MKIKTFILAVLFSIVLCFTTVNTSKADPWWIGDRIEFSIVDGHWVITIYDSNGGVIRVIAQPIG